VTSRGGAARLRPLPSSTADDAGSNEDGAVITPYEDGPLLIRGDFRLVTQDGRTIDPGRRTVALCRCGKSGTKPFCDGTHKVSKFRASDAVGG
jgi:CDGSH-type Zn-finger protein